MTVRARDAAQQLRARALVASPVVATDSAAPVAAAMGVGARGTSGSPP